MDGLNLPPKLSRFSPLRIMLLLAMLAAYHSATAMADQPSSGVLTGPVSAMEPSDAVAGELGPSMIPFEEIAPGDTVGGNLTISDSSESPHLIQSVSPLDLSEMEIELGEGEVLVEDDISIAVTPCGPTYEFGDWLGYNHYENDVTWLAAGNDLGMFSIQSNPYLPVGEDTSFQLKTGFHFLSGPTAPEMPPRLFDLQLAFLHRSVRSNQLIVDLKFSVGIFTDFEGSSRKGIRFPGSVVAYHDTAPDFATVFGIDFLDRDDVSALPVFGIVWRPVDDLVAELIFPRPRVQFRYSPTHAFYFGGELGGGTWAIERSGGIDDVATYRDLRIAFGILELTDPDDAVFEIGYAFDRELEYRERSGYTPDDAIFFRVRDYY